MNTRSRPVDNWIILREGMVRETRRVKAAARAVRYDEKIGEHGKRRK